MQMPPDLHSFPGGQRGPPPHRHKPSGPQASPVFPQSTQAEPPAPHFPFETDSQRFASLQQPAQLLASQPLPSQTPATQLFALAQGGLTPQRQVPAAEQLSAFEALQVVQTPPAVPQKPTPGALHTPLAQQPVGHVWALQAIGTQAPAVHLNEAPHAAPVPHAQAPAAVQLSAALASQAEHAAPPLPHAEKDRDVVVQTVPAQQPVGQFAAVHVFATQAPATHR
jgi:hypothetical protein